MLGKLWLVLCSLNKKIVLLTRRNVQFGSVFSGPRYDIHTWYLTTSIIYTRNSCFVLYNFVLILIYVEYIKIKTHYSYSTSLAFIGKHKTQTLKHPKKTRYVTQKLTRASSDIRGKQPHQCGQHYAQYI